MQTKSAASNIKKLTSNRSGLRAILVGAVVFLSLAGIILAVQAAGPSAASEAEDGQLTRQEMLISDATASQSEAIMFGDAPVDGGPDPDPDPGPQPGTQTLGVGGVATPAGAILSSADSTEELKIEESGTAGNPKVYDGQGHTVGTITIRADYVTVQNFNIRATSQDGVNFEGTGITVQNNDIKGVSAAGDGDMNAIEFFGNDSKILYNTAIDFVEGDPGGSHTDAIQTWVSDSHPTPSKNVIIKGNKFSGPDNPGRDNAIPSIHQCIMAEGLGRGGNSGGDGDPSNWLIADNYFKDSWNQCIKLDGIDDVTITRNEFAGDSGRVIEVTSASSNVKFYSDNKITGGYGQTGVEIVAGAGPDALQ
ncbi:hypothetical protein JNJ66_01540 [Candidatus Saccharibacteria bacterium]|nr:hypothetical protein [Candidatus Saccharibacteria bacterium]